MNPYTVLGLPQSPDTTEADIARAYRRLALLHHPDRNPDGADTFKQLAAAYGVLSDPVQRTFFDLHGVVQDNSATDNATRNKEAQVENSLDIASRVAAFYESYHQSTEEAQDVLENLIGKCKGKFDVFVRKYALIDNAQDGEVQRLVALGKRLLAGKADALLFSATTEQKKTNKKDDASPEAAAAWVGVHDRLRDDAPFCQLVKKNWVLTTSEAQVAKIVKLMDKERREAEEALAEIHGKDNIPTAAAAGQSNNKKKSSGGDMSGLQALILQRQQSSFEGLMQGLEEKYGKPKEKKGKNGSGKKRAREE